MPTVTHGPCQIRLCLSNDTSTTTLRRPHWYATGRALTFPCDAQGHFEMDALTDRARENYLYARAVVGRDYAYPAIQECAAH